jgi:hypothetical protein
MEHLSISNIKAGSKGFKTLIFFLINLQQENSIDISQEDILKN